MTPHQRAQEQLDKATTLRADLATVDAERAAAAVRRDYLAGHPDLGKPSITRGPTTSTGDTA